MAISDGRRFRGAVSGASNIAARNGNFCAVLNSVSGSACRGCRNGPPENCIVGVTGIECGGCVFCGC